MARRRVQLNDGKQKRLKSVQEGAFSNGTRREIPWGREAVFRISSVIESSAMERMAKAQMPVQTMQMAMIQGSMQGASVGGRHVAAATMTRPRR